MASGLLNELAVQQAISERSVLINPPVAQFTPQRQKGKAVQYEN
jgi:hypothetical protein